MFGKLPSPPRTTRGFSAQFHLLTLLFFALIENMIEFYTKNAPLSSVFSTFNHFLMKGNIFSPNCAAVLSLGVTHKTAPLHSYSGRKQMQRRSA